MARIFLHDYTGHAFTVQLARALAGRGHQVCYVHFQATQAPKGDLAPRADDPAGLRLVGLDIDEPFRKYSLLRRRQQDLKFAARAEAVLRSFAPDVVLSAQAAPEVHLRLRRAARKAGARFVYWVQDIWSVGARAALARKNRVLGLAVGWLLERMERDLIAGSDANVLICDDFRALALGWGARASACHVIPNWGVVEQVPVLDKDNAWSRRHGLADKTCVLYSGTLGLKHDPELLARLAQALAVRPEVRVVVVSEGQGADYLAGRKAQGGLDNLVLLPFQAFADFAQVLATGDVLVSVLEPEASIYSVPSKVLSYLCAGRAQLLSVPAVNLSARIVGEAGAGIVVPNGDATAMVAAAQRLLDAPELRREMGAAGRRHAEAHFAMAAIAPRFETVLGVTPLATDGKTAA